MGRGPLSPEHGRRLPQPVGHRRLLVDQGGRRGRLAAAEPPARDLRQRGRDALDLRHDPRPRFARDGCRGRHRRHDARRPRARLDRPDDRLQRPAVRRRVVQPHLRRRRRTTATSSSSSTTRAKAAVAAAAQPDRRHATTPTSSTGTPATIASRRGRTTTRLGTRGRGLRSRRPGSRPPEGRHRRRPRQRRARPRPAQRATPARTASRAAARQRLHQARDGEADTVRCGTGARTSRSRRLDAFDELRAVCQLRLASQERNVPSAPYRECVGRFGPSRGRPGRCPGPGSPGRSSRRA